MNLLLINFLLLFFLTTAMPNGSIIDLQIQGAKSDEGVIRILIFDSENGYPDKPELAVKSLSLQVINKRCAVRIDDLKPGTYAISVIHDEDENGKLNTNPFGYPIEKYGFSNNAKAYFSAPAFSKAAFELRNEVKKVTIDLR